MTNDNNFENEINTGEAVTNNEETLTGEAEAVTGEAETPTGEALADNAEAEEAPSANPAESAEALTDEATADETLTDEATPAEADEADGGEATPKKGKGKKVVKKVILAIVIIILVLAIAFAIIVGLNYSQFKEDCEAAEENFVLTVDSVTVEYGEEFNPELEDFVELSDIITAENTEIDYTIAYGQTYDEEDDEYITNAYPEVGEYEITVTNTVWLTFQGYNLISNSIEKTVTVTVVDTTAPTYSGTTTEFETYVNEEITQDELIEALEIEDFSEFTVAVADIDYSVAGIYKMSVVATDIYGNETAIPVTITVNEHTIYIRPTSATLAVGDEQSFTAACDSKSDGITYSSSNTSVATVDDSGVVTAVSEGTATITATHEEYGISATATVTVSNSTTASTSTSTTDCENGEHTSDAGNTGIWFDSKDDAVEYYNSIVDDLKEQLSNGEITQDEYDEQRPTGYSMWPCANCGKYTLSINYS